MNVESLLIFLTQIVFLFVAGNTVFNWAKYRTRARFDIAPVFLSLALAITAQAVQPVFPVLTPVLAPIFFISLLLHAYLLLRLVRYFVAVPAVIWRTAPISLLFVFASFTLFQCVPTLVFTLAITYFFITEGYATLLLVQGASRFHGLINKRLQLASIGSGLLAVIFFPTPAFTIISTTVNPGLYLNTVIYSAHHLHLESTWALGASASRLTQTKRPGEK